MDFTATMQRKLEALGDLAIQPGDEFTGQYEKVLGELRGAVEARIVGATEAPILIFRLKNLMIARLCYLRLQYEAGRGDWN